MSPAQAGCQLLLPLEEPRKGLPHAKGLCIVDLGEILFAHELTFGIADSPDADAVWLVLNDGPAEIREVVNGQYTRHDTRQLVGTDRSGDNCRPRDRHISGSDPPQTRAIQIEGE